MAKPNMHVITRGGETGDTPEIRKWKTNPRAVARALMGGGGGGVYSYIRVMPDGFLLKSVVFKY